MKKAILCSVLCASMVLGVSGCSFMTAEDEIVNSTKAFTAEEIKANQTAGAIAERNNIVYQYVSNSVQIDKDKLVAVEQADADLIKSSVIEINEALRTGATIKKPDGTVVSHLDIEKENKKIVETSQSSRSTTSSQESEESSDRDQPQPRTQEQSQEAQVAEVDQKSDTTIVSDSIANYMLHNFSKTLYSWNMTDCKIVGVDPATHLYFVDVSYETTSEKKNVLPQALITKGEPNYEDKELQLFNEYKTLMGYAETPTNSNVDNRAEYAEAKKIFESHWGTLDSVVSLMEYSSPLEYTEKHGSAKKGIGCFTYSGTTNSYDISSAKMSYRFVMGYNYNVNDEVRIEPKAVYMYEYKINNDEDLKKKYTQDSVSAEEVLSPLVNKLIYRYLKAMDECDNGGLYKMYKSYNKYVTEINAYNEFAYHKLGTYLYDILGRDNDKLYVEVTFNNKERSKGSAMSEATYKDSMLFTIQINEDDTLTIIDVCTLNRTLVGEPLSVIEKVTGVSEQINYSENAFTASNELAVKETITNFMKLELTKNFTSDVFTNCIDLGISNSELDNIKKTLNSVSATEIIGWITGYNSKSNLYVNAMLREVYTGTSGNKYETNANIGLINRNGKWFVVSYARTMNVRLNDGTTLSDEKCLEHYVIKDNKISSVKKDVAKVAISEAPEE